MRRAASRSRTTGQQATPGADVTLAVSENFIDGMRRFGVSAATVRAAEMRNRRVLGPCPTSDASAGPCELWDGHRCGHRHQDAPRR